MVGPDGDTAAVDADSAPGPRRRRAVTVVDLQLSSAVLVVAVGLAAAGVVAVIDQAPAMLTKIVVGVLIALALDPVVVAIARRFSWRRGTAVALVGTTLGVAFLGVLVVLGPAAIDQARNLTSDLPETVEDAYTWPVVGPRLAEAEAADDLRVAIDELPSQLDDDDLTRYAEDVLGGLFTAVVVLVTAVAVMLDGELMVSRFQRAIPDDVRPRVDAIGRVLYGTFGNYFAGSLFVAILNGLVILGTALALGIPLAPLAGVWAAITNLIPQIGGFLGGSFLVLLALTEGPVTAAIALAVFLVYQNIENHLIAPTVVGRAVDLTPPTTMLAALVGGAVAGVPGALVATPLVGAAKVLYLRDRSDGALDGIGLVEAEDTRPAR